MRWIAFVTAVVLCRVALGQCQPSWTAYPPQSGFGGPSPIVYAAAVYQDQLVMGGTFTTAGGQPIKFIARREQGGNWASLGSGIGSDVRALLPYQGVLVVGGQFIEAGGTPAKRVATWNGLSWSTLGSGMADGVVYALCEWQGNLVAGGSF